MCTYLVVFIWREFSVNESRQKLKMKVKKEVEVKKKKNQFWLDYFKIKPVKVRLDRIKIEKTTRATGMWACFECFEFMHGTSDLISAKSTTHICGAIQSSVKQNNFNAFKSSINNVSSPIAQATATGLPPKAPPPPSFLGGSYKIDNQQLTWEQLKTFKPKKYAVIQCSVEPEPVAKRILKYLPTNSKETISTYDKLNEELAMVLKYVSLFLFLFLLKILYNILYL